MTEISWDLRSPTNFYLYIVPSLLFLIGVFILLVLNVIINNHTKKCLMREVDTCKLEIWRCIADFRKWAQARRAGIDSDVLPNYQELNIRNQRLKDLIEAGAILDTGSDMLPPPPPAVSSSSYVSVNIDPHGTETTLSPAQGTAVGCCGPFARPV